ncbi:MAG: hypothetical protein K5644_03445 [Lachnospiraceae bacterium]|nr:hypothetical protein [Lachnospiraceae bacterium]
MYDEDVDDSFDSMFDYDDDGYLDPDERMMQIDYMDEEYTGRDSFDTDYDSSYGAGIPYRPSTSNTYKQNSTYKQNNTYTQSNTQNSAHNNANANQTSEVEKEKENISLAQSLVIILTLVIAVAVLAIVPKGSNYYSFLPISIGFIIGYFIDKETKYAKAFLVVSIIWSVCFLLRALTDLIGLIGNII